MDKKTYPPEIIDLCRLHQFVILNKRLTILEFGSGWSSLIMAHALMINKKNLANRSKNLESQIYLNYIF